jgi:hypothetical protein
MGELMRQDLVEAISRFNKSEKNKDVYAIAIAFAFEGLDLELCISSQTEGPPNDPRRPRDVNQERFNPWNFAYKDANVFSGDVLNLLEKYRCYSDLLSEGQDTEVLLAETGRRFVCSEWNRLREGYYGSIANALNGLDTVLSGTMQTADCIRYIYLYNNDSEGRKRHFQLTVKPEKFRRLFPDSDRSEA